MGRIIGAAGNAIAPVISGSVAHGAAEAHDIYVRGTGASKRAFTHSSGAWFYVVDISNPAAPAVIGSIRDVGATTALTGANSHWPVTPTGRYVAVTCASGQNRIQVVDVNTETVPVVAGTLIGPTTGPFANLLNGPVDIQIIESRWGYVAGEGSNTLLVVDFQTPLSPVIVGSVTDATNLGGIQGIVWDGANTIWCCANGTKRLTSVDITTRSSPAVVGSVVDPNASGVSFAAISGTTVFTIASGPANYMCSWNVANRAAPAFLNGLVNAGMDRPLGIALTADGAIACIPCQGDVGTCAFVNTSNPSSLAYLTRVTQPVAGGTPAGDPGSGELYHSFQAVWDPDGYFWVGVAGSGRTTGIALNRSTAESLRSGNGPRLS